MNFVLYTVLFSFRFPEQRRSRRVRRPLLQPRLHHAAGEAEEAVQVQVPLVLLRRVRGVRHRGRRQHVSVEFARSLHFTS